jgi:hypothetical protein
MLKNNLFSIKFITFIAGLALLGAAQAEFQVTNLSDFTLPEADLHNTNRITHSLCVYSTDATQLNYQVQIYSDAENGKFEMSNGYSKMQYQVKWSAMGNNIYVDVNPNQPEMGIASTQSDCQNANMQIVVPPENLRNVTSGEYSTMLNLVISPQ